MDIQRWIPLVAVWITCASGTTNQSLEYSWVKVVYDWPNDTMRQDYIDSKKFIPENNIITGLKVYKDDVFITVPRWRPGIPSTLNRVVMKNGKAVLQPYPSWDYQTEGECDSLQYVQSLEVDPNTGLMWIIDNGRTNILETTQINTCPPKLVIYDINKKKEVHKYTFPDDVANHTSCFLNDIVLDYVDGDVKFAYVTDTRDAKLYVYDYERDTSYFFQDETMRPTLPDGRVPIDGIAMSADFKYVYYCPIDGMGLFQIPTSVLRDKNAQFSQHVRNAGTRLSRSDGLAYGQTSLFYGLLDMSGVQQWLVAKDAEKVGYANVTMTSQESLARDDVRMKWVDTFAWDESGHLWFTANDLSKFMARTMDFTGGSGPNMYVWKVFVNESSYLSRAGDYTSSRAPSGFDNAAFVSMILIAVHLIYSFVS